MVEQIENGHGQVMVGIHQSHRTGNDAMPVCIRVVCEGDLELIFQFYEPAIA
jgi:hypothetical protein